MDSNSSLQSIYAIYDRVAKRAVGGLILYSHDAPAVRFFTDQLLDRQTYLSSHPADYDLVVCGSFEPEKCLVANRFNEMMDGGMPFVVVLSGAQWLSLQAKGPEAVSA